MQNELKKAVEIMRRGGVILYPTDTVWGIGCDATNAEAIARIYEIKRRVESKSMIVLVDSEAKIEGYVRDVPEIAWDLIMITQRTCQIILWLKMALLLYVSQKSNFLNSCVA